MKSISSEVLLSLTKTAGRASRRGRFGLVARGVEVMLEVLLLLSFVEAFGVARGLIE